MGYMRSPENEEQDSSTWEIAPFWHKLNTFFLFPLQKKPLLYAIVLSLCSNLSLMGALFGVVVSIGIMLATSRYAFKVAMYASRGITDSADYDRYGSDDDWTVLPWKFFGFLLAQNFAIGWLEKISPALGALGDLLSSFLIPATLVVLISTSSLRAALNPLNLLGAVGSIGLPYFLLCLFLFLLMQGAPAAMVLLLQITPGFLVLPLVFFASIYFSWVTAVMLGYVMYQNHAELGIEPDKAPEGAGGAKGAASAAADPATALARRRDAVVAGMVQNGDMQAALDEAREWQRLGHDSIADQRRYHRLLKLTDKTESLGHHAQRFIPLLLQKQQASEALEVWASCHKRAPDFRPEQAETTLALAQAAWKRQQAAHTLAMLQNFEKHYPGHEATPQAQELIVRALKQGVNKPDQAVRIFMRMKMRYPEHPSTQEAAWVLRDELPQAAPAQ